MTYKNNASAKINDVVKKEIARMKIGNQSYEFQWLEFVTSDLKESKIFLKDKNNAYPFMVRGGEVKAHETHFVPFEAPEKHKRDHSYLEWNKFIQIVSNQNEILFDFRFETFGGQEEKVSCRIEIDEGLRKLIKAYGWVNSLCIS